MTWAGLIALCLPLFAVISDRKSTRLNSSHITISYAVFCLKKKIFNTFPLSAIFWRLLFFLDLNHIEYYVPTTITVHIAHFVSLIVSHDLLIATYPLFTASY